MYFEAQETVRATLKSLGITIKNHPKSNLQGPSRDFTDSDSADLLSIGCKNQLDDTELGKVPSYEQEEYQKCYYFYLPYQTEDGDEDEYQFAFLQELNGRWLFCEV